MSAEATAESTANEKRFEKQRRKFAMGFLVLLLMKPFPFLHGRIPPRWRHIVTDWTYSMLWTVVSSGGQKVMADVPTKVRPPKSLAPRVEVEDEFKLSDAQMRYFWDNGFIGPIKACEPHEAEAMREEIRAVMDGESAIYGIKTDRDRHLDCPEVLKPTLLPAIAKAVAQIMGPDIQAWRTQLLFKPAGTPETAWHQVSQFILSGKSLRPVLVPPDKNELFNVTVWLAFEDVDTENGCLQFYRGSHKEPMHKMRLGVGENFGMGNRFMLEFDRKPERVHDMILKPGEFVIFHERTIHAGRAMTHPTRTRCGMNIRICKTDVRAYAGMKVQESFTFHTKFDLAKWGVVQLHGTDTHNVNKHADISRLEASLRASG